MVIPFPQIPPTIVSIGPLALRWYGLMYAVAYFVGYRIAVSRIQRGVSALTRPELDSLIGYLVVGMLIGARLAYVLFYDLAAYRLHPWDVLAVWKGGLSFHGAIAGMAVASAFFARRHRLSWFAVADTIAFVGPPGLFFGRLGNFINGELYGRPTSVPWAMVFPRDRLQVPRHPSQLYEAIAEGVVLSVIVWYLHGRSHAGGWYRPGLLTATFLIGYAAFRFALEFTRQPDAQLGLVIGIFSMGQILSAFMVLAGAVILALLFRRSPQST